MSLIGTVPGEAVSRIGTAPGGGVCSIGTQLLEKV